MKRLALDLGEARIGVAASDETGTLAVARTTLARQGFRRDVEAVRRLAEAEGAEEVVVGLPLRSDGSDGDRSLAARRFRDRAEAATRLRFVLWDERYTTAEAAELLAARGLDSRRARPLLDAEAARLILQRYLDHVNAAPAESGGSGT